MVKNSPANAGESGSISGSGRSPGEGNVNPLQYSCLGNPMDRGAWRATVHGVAKSQTRLSTHTPVIRMYSYTLSKGCSQKHFEEDRVKCDFLYSMKGSSEETHGRDLFKVSEPSQGRDKTRI